MTRAQVLVGDCLHVMAQMEACSVDAIVTDPPYELGFMGKSWDASGVAFRVEVWREALRVLKPGGHLLAFSGSRTYHRMAVAIEDAGFEIRDQIMWVYGSGFPKSLNLDGEWQGWGTALKPAHEPIVVARKPLIGTVAANVLAHGTGALNINGCRVGTGLDKGVWPITKRRHADVAYTLQPMQTDNSVGRWPANLIHDGSEEVEGFFPGDDGSSAARFFYSAKASRTDRDEGLEHMTAQAAGGLQGRHHGSLGSITMRANVHPTVKPTDLMRYLCRLVTPPGGLVLDPFTGSGSTGKGAVMEGFRFVGIELSPEYAAIARARIQHAVGYVEPQPVAQDVQDDVPTGQLRLFA